MAVVKTGLAVRRVVLASQDDRGSGLFREEQGHFDWNAVIEICVGADGLLTTASIINSSGDKEHDAVALHEVRGGKYSPAMVYGRPVASCKDIRVSWKNR